MAQGAGQEAGEVRLRARMVMVPIRRRLHMQEPSRHAERRQQQEHTVGGTQTQAHSQRQCRRLRRSYRCKVRLSAYSFGKAWLTKVICPRVPLTRTNDC